MPSLLHQNNAALIEIGCDCRGVSFRIRQRNIAIGAHEVEKVAELYYQEA